MVGEGRIEDFSLLIFEKLSSISETLAGGSLSDGCFSTSSSLDYSLGVLARPFIIGFDYWSQVLKSTQAFYNSLVK
jgi:hypothetical protein